MKSVVCVTPGQIEIQERELAPRKDNEITIKIRRVGVCGTDYHIYEGLHPFLEYPRVLGHELVGEVFEANEDSGFSVGQNVVINPYVPCGECIACRKQKPNCCVSIQVFGVHADGGMCEYLNVPENQLYAADGLSLDQAALSEFLAIGAHGVRRAEIQTGDRVLVVGAGPIGIGAALFANIAGANITILDLSPARVDKACSIIGKANGFTLNSDTLSELELHTNNDLFDVVIDATGNKQAMQNSFKFVAHGGTCLFISVIKEDITFNDPLFHSREMRLIGSRNATKQDFDHVMQSLRDGLIPVDKILTHSAPIADAAEKIPAWIHEQDTLIKAVIAM